MKFKATYVSELITDIREYPGRWTNNMGQGLTSGPIMIYDYGNGGPWGLLSIIKVKFHGYDQPMNEIDKMRLEMAVRRWYKYSSLSHVMYKHTQL